MKQLVFAFCIIALFSSMATAAIQNSPDGFRGIKWGDPPSALGDKAILVEKQESSGRTIYRKPEDKLLLGGTALDSIDYIFWENKFTMVMITASSTAEFIDLKEVAIARFGKPTQSNEYIDKYIWMDNKASIILEESTNSTLGIISVALSSEWLAQKKETAQKGAEEDF